MCLCINFVSVCMLMHCLFTLSRSETPRIPLEIGDDSEHSASLSFLGENIHAIEPRLAPILSLEGPHADNWGEEQDWISNIAAVGDSYSAGIGAGDLLDGFNSVYCGRYSESFVQLFEVLNPHPERTLTYVSCSGDVTDQIKSQVDKVPANQDIITISSGGNDANLVGLLNSCVYHWYPFGGSCENQMKNSWDIINGTDFINNLKDLAAKVAAKLSNDPKKPGKAYWTGYAQFFNAETTQCNDVTFRFWKTDIFPPYLTQDVRSELNAMTIAVNDRIKEAVKSQSDRITYVDMDTYVSMSKGRFCEEGVTEPDYDREATMFFNTYTAEPESGDDRDILKRGPETLGNTFEGQIFCNLAQALDQNGTLEEDFPQNNPVGGQDQSPPTNQKMIDLSKAMSTFKEQIASNDTAQDNATETQEFNCKTLTGRSLTVPLLPKYISRVFHPRSNLHWAMAQQISYWMSQDRAKLLYLGFAPLYDTISGNSESCPVPDPPFPPKGDPSGTNYLNTTCKDSPDVNSPNYTPILFTRDAAMDAAKDFCADISRPAQGDENGNSRYRNYVKKDNSGWSSFMFLSAQGIPGLIGWPNCNVYNSELKPNVDACLKAAATIIDGCQTDTATEKRGGSIVDGKNCFSLQVRGYYQRTKAIS